MRSVAWYNCGNANLRGKKSLALMAGKYVEEVVVNHKEAILERIVENEMREEIAAI